MDLNLFQYDFPEELVAQHPLPERDASRLMVLDPAQGGWQHRHFPDITEYFGPDDLIVFNDVKVFPSRLYAETASGRKVEILLLDEQSPDEWTCLLRPANKLKSGERIQFQQDGRTVLEAVISGSGDQWRIQFKTVGAAHRGGPQLASLAGGHGDPPLRDIISKIGLPPLPPYIKRSDPYADKLTDIDRYQCIYAEKPAAAAAPTAGFHFTENILNQLQDRGAQLAYVTLHVGRDTFQPVRTKQIEDHRMHGEHYEISAETAALINEAKRNGKRITAVGTTTVRVLESVGADLCVGPQSAPDAGAHAGAPLRPGKGFTNIFIYPGYKFKTVDRLLSNFHQPKSTLLMLVSALAGREFILQAYQDAIQAKYRLFSFGDAMLILN